MRSKSGRKTQLTNEELDFLIMLVNTAQFELLKEGEGDSKLAKKLPVLWNKLKDIKEAK